MRFLHTSDWHLGQKFFNYDRDQEQALALRWLLDTVREQKVDCLLVSGDIFDTFNPPASAQELYYNFLINLTQTSCRHVVVTAGNHDSPSLLQAPKQLLKAMNVHVIGSVGQDLSDEIIELKDASGKVEAMVAAVPFLRDRDLLFAQPGESGLERIERIKLGIKTHFQKIGELVAEKLPAGIPALAMAHLYAFGAESAEKQDNIYIGDKANIRAEDFPAVFKYVALGHIHRPQKIGVFDHIRYSGSLIPLSFSEEKDEKSVYLADFTGGQMSDLKTIKVPEFRRLKTISGEPEAIQKRLVEFEKRHRDELTPFVEIIVETDQNIPDLDSDLRAFAKDLKVHILSIRLNRKQRFSEFQQQEKELTELGVLEVFQKKCEQFGVPEAIQPELEASFRELLEGLET